jgi:membrane-bound lytic murein transglycosylase B
MSSFHATRAAQPPASRRGGRCSALLLLGALCLTQAASYAAAPLDRAEVQRFVAEMSANHGFDAAALDALFGRASRLDSVLAAISKPAEYKPWHVYRPIFLTRERVNGGLAFWREHEATLSAAARSSGVPPEIIVAIIGVETSYGRNTGSYKVLDSLATLAFHYPKRAPFFRSELENFLLLTREEGMDPLQPTGSYAGAMGLPQFMPSSFRNYAVDFDQDGRRDIWRNPRDAIGSVGNYLNRHGWRAGEVIAMPAAQSAANASQVSDTVDLKRSVAEYAALGVHPIEALGPAAKAAPAVLLGYEASSDATEYWLGFRNFYAITRYNRSPKYALAVVQLAEAIAQARRGAGL